MKKISKFLAILIIWLFVSFFVIGAIFPVASINLASDHYFHYLYSIKKEEGNASINVMVTQTEEYNKSISRLTKIASLITQNFTDYWWIYQRDERFCRYNDSNGSIVFNWCSPLYGTPLYNIFEKNPDAYMYFADKIGNVTIRETNDLSFNPNWIAYQKAGGCQAISILFNETANRSGFVTRIVRSNGNSHMWNEVYFDGKWKYFDVQRYGEKNGSDPSYYGDTKNYSEDIYSLTRCGVYVLNWSDYGFGENITQLYDPDFLYPHGTYNSPGCSDP
ncbi:MAG: transglutaminase domain-containing protein [Methanoregula sp.]|jgi:hypothetical protein|nr:transglutaminase domain-containing protein [Methanoregula sp.]